MTERTAAEMVDELKKILELFYGDPLDAHILATFHDLKAKLQAPQLSPEQSDLIRDAYHVCDNTEYSSDEKLARKIRAAFPHIFKESP